jgi:CDP-glycerol glycerophosphotransferase (TagB/SpsB family)
MNRPLVLFIKVYAWHGPMLDRVLPLLPAEMDVLSIDGRSLDEGWRPEKSPALVVLADAGAIRHLRPAFPGALFLHVGHGLISKNETGYHYHQADYICVASDAAADRLLQRGHVPRKAYLATGLVQMDPLFSAGETADMLRVPEVPVSILYAPTWNPSLSSAMMFGTTLVTAIRGNDDRIGLVIKPHPHTAVAHPEWIAMWRQLALDGPNVMLTDPQSDLVPAMLGADLMISDASSAMFQFLALNRPMILVDNPQRLSAPGCFDPAGIEWRWRDIGVRVQDAGEVASAVRDALQTPESPLQQSLQAARQRRRTELFGSLTDGRAAERVASAIQKIIVAASGKSGKCWP